MTPREETAKALDELTGKPEPEREALLLMLMKPSPEKAALLTEKAREYIRLVDQRDR